MELQVVSGTGSAKTELAAFDAALITAGIANYNLLVLSSVIPPKSTILQHQSALPQTPGTWGDRLYVVMAEQRTAEPGHEAWAGVGWIQEAASGKGLLVEHHGGTKQQVEQDIQASLAALAAGRPGVSFGPVGMRVAGVRCEGAAVCGLVAVVFKAEPWNLID